MRYRKESFLIRLLRWLSVAALLFSFFAIVWLRSSVVSVEYSLSRLEKKEADLAKEKKTLVAERANLLYVGRLEAVAANGSGLVFPDRAKVVYVKRAMKQEPYKVALMVKGEAGQDRR
ncbi:MAG: hypothetical protein IT388_00395 [Nitrospirales bacterium]|nr:hypothetical protein [Nitrospirales bacterium]